MAEESQPPSEEGPAPAAHAPSSTASTTGPWAPAPVEPALPVEPAGPAPEQGPPAESPHGEQDAPTGAATAGGGSGVPSEEDVMEALSNVIDPELGLDFVELGLIYGVEVDRGDVHVTFTLTTPACPIGPARDRTDRGIRGRTGRRQERLLGDGLHAPVVAGADERGRASSRSGSRNPRTLSHACRRIRCAPSPAAQPS